MSVTFERASPRKSGRLSDPFLNPIKVSTPANWKRLSAPNSVTPRCSSNQELVLKTKLNEEELILRNDIARSMAYKKNSRQRQSIQRKIDIRTNLVNAMRNTLELQENVVLNSGYIQLKKAQTENYQKYWCVIEYPYIKLFKSEKDCFPLELIKIDKASQIVVGEFNFTIHIDKKDKLYFMNDSIEECKQWTKAITFSSGIPIINAKDTVVKKSRRLSSAAPSSSEVCVHPDSIVDTYQNPECENFEVIKESFSNDILVEYIDGKYYLKSGTLEDILKWCIIHCKTRRNKSAAAILLCKHWICEPDEFSKAIIDVWKTWDESGFPFGYPKNVVSERFSNFAKQYIENPIVGIQIWNTEKCTVLRQREILHRRQTQLTLGELHPYFKKTLETAKVRPRTVSITLTNEEQKEYVEEIMTFGVKEIASQITLIQAKLFEKIHLDELMDKNWENPEKCPKLTVFTNHSNGISSWVIISILSGKDMRDQLSRYIKFIKIADYLHSIKNFNSCVSVLGGIDSAPISRLKRLKGIPDSLQSKLEKLKQLYSPLNGYRTYRNFAKQVKCIPLVGVYLRDLTLISDGNAKYINEDKSIINFDRMKLIADRVLEFNQINASLYAQELTPIPTLKSSLENLKIYTEDELYEKSLAIQPITITKSPEQQLAELQDKFERYKSETQVQFDTLQSQLEKLQEQLQSTDTAFTNYKEKKDPKSSSKTKKELNNIKVQLLNAMLLCDELIDEPLE